MSSSLLSPAASNFSARALVSFKEENPSSVSLLPKQACTGILILPTSHTVRAGMAPVRGGGAVREAPPERDIFFTLQVYERVAILLA